MAKSPINIIFLFLFSIALFSCQNRAQSEQAQEQEQQQTSETMKALIIDGQNNHGIWPKTTVMMKDYLEQTGLFEVDVDRTAYTWQGPHSDNDPGLGKEKREKLIENYSVSSNNQTTMVEEPQPDPNYTPKFSEYDVVISNFGWRADGGRRSAIMSALIDPRGAGLRACCDRCRVVRRVALHAWVFTMPGTVGGRKCLP